MNYFHKKKLKVKKSFKFRKKKNNQINSRMSFNKIKRKSLIFTLIIIVLKKNINVKVLIINKNKV